MEKDKQMATTQDTENVAGGRLPVADTVATRHRPPATGNQSQFISPVEIIRIAWEGVARNKVRSLLTMLGVIIGVAAVIIMIAISAGTERAIAEQIQGLGSNLVFIQGGLGRGNPGSGMGSTAPQLLYQDTAVDPKRFRRRRHRGGAKYGSIGAGGQYAVGQCGAGRHDPGLSYRA
jgi:hypothetical protein